MGIQFNGFDLSLLCFGYLIHYLMGLIGLCSYSLSSGFFLKPEFDPKKQKLIIFFYLIQSEWFSDFAIVSV